MFDYLDPFRQKMFQTLADWDSYNESCADDGNPSIPSKRRVLDWMHMNSVSISENGEDDFIVSLHNLNTIMSFKIDGSGLNWVLSAGFAVSE